MVPSGWIAGLRRLRDPETLSDEMRRDLVVAVYDNLIPIAIMTVSFAALGGAITAENPDLLLRILFGAGLAAAFARLGIVTACRPRRGERPGPDSIRRRERIFAAGSLAFAIALGSFGFRAAAIGSASHRMLVVAMLAGYGSGVVARVSPRPWISVPCLIIAILPGAAAFGLRGPVDDRLVGAALCLFAIGGIQTVAYIYRSLRRHLRMRRHLAGLARLDALTGLPNRLLLEERLAGEIARLRRTGGTAALHYLDLDGFKGVNDNLGHQCGDRLLKEVAGRLGGLLRGGDMAARIGGDEFVVLQAGCAHAEEAELLGRRIGRAILAPFDLDGQEVTIATSIGIAVAPGDAGTPETWIAAADAALYRAKARGRNRIVMAADREAALAS